MSNEKRLRNLGLTRETFNAFLAALDPDRERASEEYEKLRQRLVFFFRYRHCDPAEDLADAVIDRTARRIGEVAVENVFRFALGVARRLALEQYRSAQHTVSIHEGSHALETTDNKEEDPAELLQMQDRVFCLERCMGRMNVQDRQLITEYYQHQGTQKIEARRQMAEARGISANALRIRGMRVRTALERCVTECLKGSRRS